MPPFVNNKGSNNFFNSFSERFVSFKATSMIGNPNLYAFLAIYAPFS